MFAAFLLGLALTLGAALPCRGAELLTNGSVEQLNTQGLPADWDYRSNVSAGVNTNPANARTGNNSLTFDLTPGSNPEWDHKLFAVTPDKVYRIKCCYKTLTAFSNGCLDVYVRWWPGMSRVNLVSQERLKTDIGRAVTSGWEEVDRIVTAPAGAIAGEVIVWSVASGPNGLVCMDDFSFSDALIHRVFEPRPYPTIFPKSAKPPAAHLALFDLRSKSRDIAIAVSTLQGLVNRSEPRIYTLNQDCDTTWLEHMRQKGYTQAPTTVTSWVSLVNQYKGELAGKIIYDPNLPGSVQAACMIGSVRNAIAMSPTLEWQVDLPLVEDLRGRWTRNVDAYRYVYNTCWPQMNHHFLASVYPLTAAQYVRDYLTEFKVFTFWLSADDDAEPGAAPTEERAFISELFANTPTSVPVWGWYSYGLDKGISEYEGMKWGSQYGKFLPGTEFSSNLSVLSGVTVPPATFRQNQTSGSPHLTLDNSKVYVCPNILDSGDAQWYWQSYQRGVWADAARGSVPIGWSLNPTVMDSMPSVLQWYYENATPNDYFFSAVSGLGYMFTTHFSEVFVEREEAWQEYISLTSQYCNSLGLDIVELYDGAWNEATPPSTKILSYYTQGVAGLRGLFPDLGRHDNMTGDKASYYFDGVPVFHCLSRWMTWTGDPGTHTRQEEIDWARNEVLNHTPTQRPGFMNALMISWTMYPNLIRDVMAGLPSEYVAVTPHQLLDLYEQYLASRNWALNGNFERGTLDYWQYWRRGAAGGTATIVNDDHTGQGRCACRLTRTTTGAFADEDIVFISNNEPLYPNAQARKSKQYQLTFWAKTGQAQPQKFRVSLTPFESPDFYNLMTETLSGAEISSQLTAGQLWQQYSMTIQIPLNSTRRVQINIRLADDNLRGVAGDLVIDDIVMTEVPSAEIGEWCLY